MYLLKEQKIMYEAFQAGTAAKLIDKVGRVLSRKLGRTVTFSDVPMQYVNTYGKFMGFYCSVVGMDKLFRLNFKITKSDEFSSFDIWNVPSPKPTATVELEGFNVVQTINIMAEEIDGTLELEESIIQERGDPGSYDDRKSMVQLYIKENPDAMDQLMNQPLAKVYSTTYLKWAENSERALFPQYLFVQIVKELLFDKGLTNISFRKRKKGSIERIVVDQALSDKFDDEVSNTDWREKFELLEFYVDQVADGRVQSLVCWGSPGSGKSKTVYDTLQKAGVVFQKFKGGLKSTDYLINILSKYRDNTVIVFDDIDDSMKGDNIDILKTATEQGTNREITYKDKIIDFNSGIIFISNKTTFNAALLSRSATVEISLSNEQMMDKIDSTIDEFLPDVDLVIKKEVYDWLLEIIKGIKTIDYRQFEMCVTLRLGAPQGKWKKWAIIQLKAQENF